MKIQFVLIFLIENMNGINYKLCMVDKHKCTNIQHVCVMLFIFLIG